MIIEERISANVLDCSVKVELTNADLPRLAAVLRGSSSSCWATTLLRATASKPRPRCGPPARRVPNVSGAQPLPEPAWRGERGQVGTAENVQAQAGD